MRARNSSFVAISNEIIIANSGTGNSRGIWLWGTETAYPSIHNYTILARWRGIVIDRRDSTLANNSVVVTDVLYGTYIVESPHYESDPVVIRNCNLLGTYLYFDLDSMISISTIAGVEALNDIGTLSGSISADPGFVDQANRDYHLNGLAVNEVLYGGLDPSSIFTTDLDGNTRTTGWLAGKAPPAV